MRAVFTALRNRFHSNSTLKRVGRDLYVGLSEKEKLTVTKPYVEVNLTRTRSQDTFDSDIDDWKCEFVYHAKDMRSTAAFDWQEVMRTVYKDGNITSPEFHCAGMSLDSTEGPSTAKGTYDAKATFTLTLQRFVRNPVTART